jgi:hypothetical protein
MNDPWSPSPPAHGLYCLLATPERVSGICFKKAESNTKKQAHIQQTREA